MKKLNAIHLTLLIICLAAANPPARAQTVTLVNSNGVVNSHSSFDCSTNQVITVNSFIGYFGEATISFYDGLKITMRCSQYGVVASGSAPIVFNGSAVFTGVTNIVVDSFTEVAALTFTVTTPTPQSMIPANAVVIPSDATGPVQIVLESSSDLINWTSSLPGTYGNTHSNRFFRVRAIAQ